VRVKQLVLRPGMALGAMQGKGCKRVLVNLVTMAPMHCWLAVC